MLLHTINNSISDKTKHFNENTLIALFNKKSTNLTELDKYAIDTIQTEATTQEINNFVKKYNVPTAKLEYILTINPYPR